MIIDDDNCLRLGMRKALEERGHVVRDAPSRKVGMSMVRKRPPDLIVTVQVSPDTRSEPTLRAIRARFPRLKLLVMSRNGAGGDRQPRPNPKALGADAALIKPFRAQELCTAVEDLLKAG
jgi:DNA-binding response OmpR family regulator